MLYPKIHSLESMIGIHSDIATGVMRGSHSSERILTVEDYNGAVKHLLTNLYKEVFSMSPACKENHVQKGDILALLEDMRIAFNGNG